jgi:hypothetical protein
MTGLITAVKGLDILAVMIMYSYQNTHIQQSNQTQIQLNFNSSQYFGTGISITIAVMVTWSCLSSRALFVIQEGWCREWHWHINRSFMTHILLNTTCEMGQESKPWWLMAIYLFNSSDYSILCFQGPTLKLSSREKPLYIHHTVFIIVTDYCNHSCALCHFPKCCSR